MSFSSLKKCFSSQLPEVFVMSINRAYILELKPCCHDVYFCTSRWLSGITLRSFHFWVVAVQLPCRVRLSSTLWTAARKAALLLTTSWRLPKFLSDELVMRSDHLILCHPPLLPSVFPGISLFQWVSCLRHGFVSVDMRDIGLQSVNIRFLIVLVRCCHYTMFISGWEKNTNVFK